FPNGLQLSVHLGVLIGDIVASHKVVGFASHAAKLFCSWCKFQKNDMMLLQKGRQQIKQERLLRLNGMCKINCLPYWDPVRNIALGVMHNWYKGFLQHHCRVRWAFESNPPKQLSHNEQLDDWEDNVSEDNETSSEFQESTLLHIRKALPSIIVPRGVTCIPLDLKDPKHGKLKASEWHVLFSTYLHLSLIDFFVKNPAY
ncbi:hypothetical protein VP01_11574g1, partial [Puccinia sorghi]